MGSSKKNFRSPSKLWGIFGPFFWGSKNTHCFNFHGHGFHVFFPKIHHRSSSHWAVNRRAALPSDGTATAPFGENGSRGFPTEPLSRGNSCGPGWRDGCRSFNPGGGFSRCTKRGVKRGKNQGETGKLEEFSSGKKTAVILESWK